MNGVNFGAETDPSAKPQQSLLRQYVSLYFSIYSYVHICIYRYLHISMYMYVFTYKQMMYLHPESSYFILILL
jgi:magnesium-transporting ATPase (P-type)